MDAKTNTSQDGWLAFLYISGAEPFDIASLVECAPDTVIIDLEESVAPPAYEAARSALPTMIAELLADGLPVIVRIKGFDTSDGMADAHALAGLSSNVGVLLPKPVTGQHIASLRAITGHRPLWVMGEEAGFATHIGTLCRHQKLSGIIVGTKDLALSLARRAGAGGISTAAETEAIRAAGHLAGLPVLAGVALGDAQAVRTAADAARAAGFDGISLIRAKDVANARSL